MKISTYRWKTPTGGSTSHRWMQQSLNCLSSRFQSAFELPCNIESVFIEVPTTQNISAHYGDDIDDMRLHLHLSMLGDLRRYAEPPVTLTVTGIADVVQLFTDNVVWLVVTVLLLPEVVSLLRLFLTLPVTSCTAERRFSCLRRLKTFLRYCNSKETQSHCNIALPP